jgi:hypothetical protein
MNKPLLRSVLAVTVIMIGRFAQAQQPPTGAERPGATTQTGVTTGAITPTEEEAFIFSSHGRRDPFLPPFGILEEGKGGGKRSPGTRDTITRASKLLDDLSQAAKGKNLAHFNTVYDSLMSMLDTNFTSKELEIYAKEIARRAKQMKDEMGQYAKNVAIEGALQNVERRIADLQAQIQQKKFEEARETYQTVTSELTALQTDDEALKQKRDALVLRAGQLVSQIARELFASAQTTVVAMKEKLQKGQYEDVSTEFQNLKNRIGALNLTDPELLQLRAKLLNEAAELSHQAEVGAIKRELKKAEELLGQMTAALNANDFGTVTKGCLKCQDILKPLQISDQDLSLQKANTLEKAADLDRRAKIRAEFAGREDIKISAIAWSEENPAAIINGRTYGHGDSLDEATRIVKIEKSEIVFNFKGENVSKPLTP